MATTNEAPKKKILNCPVVCELTADQAKAIVRNVQISQEQSIELEARLDYVDDEGNGVWAVFVRSDIEMDMQDTDSAVCTAFAYIATEAANAFLELEEGG